MSVKTSKRPHWNTSKRLLTILDPALALFVFRVGGLRVGVEVEALRVVFLGCMSVLGILLGFIRYIATVLGLIWKL